MFRGNCPTRLDEKGRLKCLPISSMKSTASMTANSISPAWMALLSNCIPSRSGKRLRRGRRTSRSRTGRCRSFWTPRATTDSRAAMDGQGRLTIAEWLRNKFGLKGEIDLVIVGKAERTWRSASMDEFAKTVEGNPITHEELERVAAGRNLVGGPRQGVRRR